MRRLRGRAGTHYRGGDGDQQCAPPPIAEIIAVARVRMLLVMGMSCGRRMDGGRGWMRDWSVSHCV